MRAVVLEPNAENRDGLQRELDELPGFQLVGESVTWDECISLLDDYLPEVLITRATFEVPHSVKFASENAFPVIVGLRPKDCRVTLDCAFETVNIPVDPESLRTAMERVRTEIYRRKLEELSVLLRHYMNFSAGQRYLTSVRVEDGVTSEIPAEHVMFLAADGNYVRIHTGANVHEVRDTMSGMTTKLDPEQFARVHRSFIVNRAHVRSVLRKDGTATCVLLANGAEIPVGPNYRAEVDSFETLAHRLSA
jgi:hypothetical protein